LWVEPDIRKTIVTYVNTMAERTGLSKRRLIRWIGVQPGKFYDWQGRVNKPNRHNGQIPKQHWLLPWEREAIINYAKTHRMRGYRRMTYEMLDRGIVAVSPASTYRVLKSFGLMNHWNIGVDRTAKQGFHHPLRPHEQWHMDIKYVNFRGTFLFLISVIDGYSRYIVHHELRTQMEEYDVELTLQRALENFPGVCPTIISDNGSQFISKDFKLFLQEIGLQHVRTAVRHPQSNGKIERFHRTINQECLSRQSLLDLQDARHQIAQYIQRYNTKRLHSALYYLTPEDFLLGRIEQRLTERNRRLEEARVNRINTRVEMTNSTLFDVPN